MASPILEPVEELPSYSESLAAEWTSAPVSTLSRSSSLGSMSTIGSSYGVEDDSLPHYSPAITMRGQLNVKQELVTPFRRAMRRSWRLTEVEINNTQLRLEALVGGVFRMTQLFTLQFAEVGLASDYTKKSNMIRLRIEARQFLIECESREEMLRWLVAFQTAICLALPLELRTLPEDSGRRRNKLRDRERREERCRRREREALEDPGVLSTTSEDRFSSTEQDAAAAQVPRPERRRRHDPSKWNPRTRQSRFSEKDFPHLAADATWDGKDVLYKGRWGLISNQFIVFFATPQVL